MEIGRRPACHPLDCEVMDAHGWCGSRLAGAVESRAAKSHFMGRQEDGGGAPNGPTGRRAIDVVSERSCRGAQARASDLAGIRHMGGDAYPSAVCRVPQDSPEPGGNQMQPRCFGQATHNQCLAGGFDIGRGSIKNGMPVSTGFLRGKQSRAGFFKDAGQARFPACSC